MKFKRKRKVLSIAVIIILSLLAAVLAGVCLTSPALIKSAYYELLDGRNQQLSIDDFTINGYALQGNNLTTTSGTVNYLLYNGINRKVGTVTVHLTQPLQEDMAASLYYTRDNQDFNESMRIPMQGRQGDSILVFIVNSPVQNMRLDIGESIGNGFSLGSVAINEPLRTIKELIKGAVQPMELSRSSLFLVLFMFIGLHFLFDIKSMYNLLFRYRYIAAALLLLFLAVQQYHGSSIGIYNNFVQPGQGSDFVSPVLGHARGIRSDEWAVNTPWKLASAFGDHPFQEYNNIMRATKTLNLGTSQLYFGYASLANPLTFFIYIFGMAGFGAYWYGLLILCFMVSFEMCLILCKEKKLFALVGAFLITFSAYFQWWSYVTWIIYGQAILVCCYYFFTTDKIWKRALLAAGIGISGATYICILYPAWIIPAGYLIIAVFAWMIVDKWKAIKGLRWKDWGIFALGIVLCLSIVMAYLMADSDYMKAITQTVYPGARFSQGGLSLPLIFNYFKSPLYPYINTGNPCEASTFLSLYPVTTVMGLYLWFKSKKKDLLLTILLVYSLFLTIYVTVGFPAFIAKYTLMSYTTADRALNILDFIQVYLLLMVMTRYENIPKMKPAAGIGVSIGAIGLAAWFACNSVPGYVPTWYIVVACVVFAWICFCVLCRISEKMKMAMCLALIGISLITGLTVNPIQKGFDVIYSKPVAKEISEIVKQDSSSKWIGVDELTLPGFLISCGAPTVNSVNNYPNMDLWKILDPEGKYNQIYNRYAHMGITLTNEEASYPKLIQEDYLELHLNYQDMKKIGIKYIFVEHPLQPGQGIDLKLLYNEDGSYIYEVLS